MWLTAAATVLAVLAAGLQYAVPAAVPVLERDAEGLAAGEWWRVVTPLLVQTLGWHQVLANLATLPAVGAVVELWCGRARWLAYAAAGTVAGQVAAYGWGDPGGGDSILVAGLAGGAVVALLRADGPPRWMPAVVLGYLAMITGWGFGGVLGAAGAVAITGAVLATSRRWELPGLVVALLCAVVLAVAQEDLHGVATLAGAAVAALPPRPARSAAVSRAGPSR